MSRKVCEWVLITPFLKQSIRGCPCHHVVRRKKGPFIVVTIMCSRRVAGGGAERTEPGLLKMRIQSRQTTIELATANICTTKCLLLVQVRFQPCRSQGGWVRARATGKAGARLQLTPYRRALQCYYLLLVAPAAVVREAATIINGASTGLPRKSACLQVRSASWLVLRTCTSYLLQLSSSSCRHSGPAPTLSKYDGVVPSVTTLVIYFLVPLLTPRFSFSIFVRVLRSSNDNGLNSSHTQPLAHHYPPSPLTG